MQGLQAAAQAMQPLIRRMLASVFGMEVAPVKDGQSNAVYLTQLRTPLLLIWRLTDEV